jgi:hypothetical protein
LFLERAVRRRGGSKTGKKKRGRKKANSSSSQPRQAEYCNEKNKVNPLGYHER